MAPERIGTSISTDGTLRTDGQAPILTIQLGDIGGFSLEPDLAVDMLRVVYTELSRSGQDVSARFCLRLIDALEGQTNAE